MFYADVSAQLNGSFDRPLMFVEDDRIEALAFTLARTLVSNASHIGDGRSVVIEIQCRPDAVSSS